MADKKKNRSSSKQARDGIRRAGSAEVYGVRTAGDATLAKLLAEALVASGPVDRATHGFHTYPAGLHPDAAKLVIEACPGAVHDPFCGGGTVLIEAVLAGRATSGTDLSPIAVLVARTRLAGPQWATPIRSAARRLAEKAQLRVDVAVPEQCERWYQPHVAQEIGRLRDGIMEEAPEVQPYLNGLLSSIVVKASFRKSDTSNQRVTHHRPPGTTAILFHKKARELGRKLESLPTEINVRVRAGDARFVPPPEGTGLVLTSPPYPGVYDYLPMQQLRFGWLGIDAKSELGAEVGSRRSFRARGRAAAFRQWRDATNRWIETQASGLKTNGWMGIVVGDGLVGGKMVDALSPTVEAMRAAGMEVVARASADRPDHARGSVRIEHLVLGQKRV